MLALKQTPVSAWGVSERPIFSRVVTIYRNMWIVGVRGDFHQGGRAVICPVPRTAAYVANPNKQFGNTQTHHVSP